MTTDALKCHGCGAESGESQVFAREAIPFRKERSYCPKCHSRLHHRINVVMLLAFAIFGALGVVVILMRPDSGFGRRLVGLALFQVMVCGCVLLHEFGHAAGACAVGFKVQRIVFGFGRRLFLLRVFGLPLDIRTWPYGGLCYAEPRGEKWLLARYFVFVVAGPATNAALAFAAHAALGTGVSLSFQFGGAAALGRLFVLSNVLMAGANLIPFVVPFPEGRFPSDGLGLWQILMQRRLPHVPRRPEREDSKGRRILFAISKWVGVTLLCLCCAICLFVAAIFVWSPVRAWPIAILFVGLGATLGWITVRAAREPFRRRVQSDSKAMNAEDFNQRFLEQMAKAERWGTHPQFAQAYGSISECLLQKQWVEAEAVLKPAMEHFPASVHLLWLKAHVLSETKRFTEAAEQFALIVAQPDLGDTAKVAIGGEHAKALVRAGDYAKARAVSEHYLSTVTLPSAKSLLLDRLASLAVIDGLTGYAQEAYHWCERALEADPASITLRGTKGSILIELGRAAEGVPILEQVYRLSRSDVDQGISALYLAIAAQNAGDTKTARRWTRRARWLYPEPWLVQRLIERKLL